MGDKPLSEEMPERIWVGRFANDSASAFPQREYLHHLGTEYIRADLVKQAKREVLEDFYRRLQQHRETIVSDSGPHTLGARVRVWKRAQRAVAGIISEMREELGP